MKWKWNWLRNHAVVPYKVLLWLERKAELESYWNGIEFQEQLAAQCVEWSKTDNYVRIVKENKQ